MARNGNIVVPVWSQVTGQFASGCPTNFPEILMQIGNISMASSLSYKFKNNKTDSNYPKIHYL
jgi:hypothetical protein